MIRISTYLSYWILDSTANTLIMCQTYSDRIKKLIIMNNFDHITDKNFIKNALHYI